MPTINVLSKNKKNITCFYLKIIIFIAVKYCSILHGHFCVMSLLTLVPPEVLLSVENTHMATKYLMLLKGSLISKSPACLKIYLYKQTFQFCQGDRYLCLSISNMLYK